MTAAPARRADRIAPIKSPFPWFGGKSRAASIIWSRLGDVAHYIEPFAGSLAVMLHRPTPMRWATVNDLDCYVANFWRAVSRRPDLVAKHANQPINEADMHARHIWLVNRVEFRERIKTQIGYYDTKIAGWWVWGQQMWIGHGWCSASPGERPRRQRFDTQVRLPSERKWGNAASPMELTEYMAALCDRLIDVRILCGDWRRTVATPSSTTHHGLCGVVLDPPYAAETGRDMRLYAQDSGTISHDVRKWAIEHGRDAKMRIALCGLAGEHVMPDDWECVGWKRLGGMAATGKHRKSCQRDTERVWFSPHCLR